jgi:hypothetical protein
MWLAGNAAAGCRFCHKTPVIHVQEGPGEDVEAWLRKPWIVKKSNLGKMTLIQPLPREFKFNEQKEKEEA